MSSPRSRARSTCAQIYADAVSRSEAAAHQNIADDIIELIISTLLNWGSLPRACLADPPDVEDLFAEIADLLSDAMDGISSGHLKALNAARGISQ